MVRWNVRQIFPLIDTGIRVSEHCRMQGFFQVRKQMQEQIDPSRQRVESTPHRNPELQVREQLPTPEKPVGHTQSQRRGSRHTDRCSRMVKATALRHL